MQKERCSMIDLINKKWLRTKNRNITIKREKNKLMIQNKSNKIGIVFCFKLFKKTKNGIKIDFRGKITEGEAVVLELINRHKEILAETTLNSTMFTGDDYFKYYLIALKVFPNTSVEIDKIDFYLISGDYLGFKLTEIK